MSCRWPQGAAAPSGKSDEATGFVAEAGALVDQGTATAAQSQGQYEAGDLAALWAEYHRQQAAYQEAYQQPHAQQWPQQAQQQPWGQPGPHAAPWQGDDVVPAQAPPQALAADGGPPLEKIPDPAGYGLWEETMCVLRFLIFLLGNVYAHLLMS